MGNCIGSTSHTHHTDYGYGEETSGKYSSATHRSNTTMSIYALSPPEREEFLNSHDPMRQLGLTYNTRLYRSTEREYIQDGRLSGNPHSVAKIADHEQVKPNPYLSGSYIPVNKYVKDLEQPALNVMAGRDAREGAMSYSHNHSNRRVTVEMRLGDFLNQGGKVYRDVSATVSDDTSTALIVTLPHGASVPVTELD